MGIAFVPIKMQTQRTQFARGKFEFIRNEKIRSKQRSKHEFIRLTLEIRLRLTSLILNEFGYFCGSPVTVALANTKVSTKKTTEEQKITL